MSEKLEQFDERFRSRPGFALVSELQFDESGVDPVGLRQLNLDLMDTAFPGINNVTSHIRPYAFMAWAWAKARQVASRNGSVDPHSDVLRDLVARYEVMYAWSHSLAAAPGLAGYTILRRHMPLNGDTQTFHFAGTKWDALRSERQSNTAIMAAVQYGPSIKSLRWLLPSDDGTFRPSLQVGEAVAAIESLVSANIPERLLGLEAPAVSALEVEPFQLNLNVISCTLAEQRCFTTLFHALGAESSADRSFVRRRWTLNLIRDLLRTAGRPMSPDELRRAFASAQSPISATPEAALESRSSLAVLSVLQARQLQRLAVEAMLVWTEQAIVELGEVASTDELAEKANAQAVAADPSAEAGTVGAYLEAVRLRAGAAGWPTAAGETACDVVELTKRIEVAQRAEKQLLPSLCLRAFAVVHAVTQGLRQWGIEEGPNDPLAGRSDRLPMATASKTLEALADVPMQILWRRVIEAWVIGQHVRWSALRGGDGKKRLRIALDSGGWIRVRSGFSGPFAPTPDRLAKLLALGAECGLFECIDAGEGNLVFGLAAAS